MNGLLCVGGPADGTYQTVHRNDLYHRKLVTVRGAPYRVWKWIDNDQLIIRERHYLVPDGWTGFDLLDHLERRAYSQGDI